MNKQHGKLIAIEGIDGAGKQTQTKLLVEALDCMGYKVKPLSFPCYDAPHSALVKYYLDGGFGPDPMAVSPYAASSCYAIDRYGSFVNNWEKDYDDPDTIIVVDRYVASNAIYQGAKFKSIAEAQAFCSWLDTFEHTQLGLPRPDMTIFLDVQRDVTIKLIEHRENKFSHEDKKDIHESDTAFMDRSANMARTLAKSYGWTTIQCCQDGEMRIRTDIAQEVIQKVLVFLEGEK